MDSKYSGNYESKYDGKCDNKYDKSKCIPKCKGEVVESATLTECENWPIKPRGKECDLVAKIAVVLAELKIQIDTESIIKLPEKAYDIKFIKKNLFLTQCKVMPKTNKLFLKGFVKKNIVYSTATCVCHDVVSGDVKHTTVKIPFECVTEVYFDIEPEFSIVPATTEVQIYDPCTMGRDIDEMNFRDAENFSEKIFCELISANIYETDIIDDNKCCEDYSYDKKDSYGRTFDKITEKMVVYLKLKLLQKQQVKIHAHKHEHCHDYDGFPGCGHEEQCKEKKKKDLDEDMKFYEKEYEKCHGEKKPCEKKYKNEFEDEDC